MSFLSSAQYTKANSNDFDLWILTIYGCDFVSDFKSGLFRLTNLLVHTVTDLNLYTEVPRAYLQFFLLTL